MEENNGYVAAVDLGTTKVVMAVGRKADKNKIEVIAIKEVPSVGIMKGDLRNIEQTSQALREVKQKLEAEHNIILHEAYVGVSGQHIRCNRTQGYVSVQSVTPSGVSEVRQQDVQRLIDDQRNASIPVGQTIISILPQSFILDGEDDITEPVGMEGRKLEAKFNVIIGEEASIERIHRCFQRAGLKLSGIVLQPLASAEAVLSDDEKELGVAVVDIGGGTTDLCIYYDKVIRHIAVIPVGGNIINKDIHSYGILKRYIEKLKVNYGEAVPERATADKYITIPSVGGQAPKEIAVRTLAGIIEARMYDIIEYVKLEIEKCGYKNKLGAGIVLTGGGANLKNLDLLFKSNTDMDVRVGQPTVYVTPESADLVGSPKYATLTGIILDTLRQGKTTDIEARPEGYIDYNDMQSAENFDTGSSATTSGPTGAGPVPSASTAATGNTPPLGTSLPQGGYRPDGQPVNNQWEPEEPEFPEGEPKVKRRSLGQRLKKTFDSMFSEPEVDDGEEYDGRY